MNEEGQQSLELVLLRRSAALDGHPEPYLELEAGTFFSIGDKQITEDAGEPNPASNPRRDGAPGCSGLSSVGW